MNGIFLFDLRNELTILVVPAELLDNEFLVRNELDFTRSAIDDKFDFIISQELDILNWMD